MEFSCIGDWMGSIYDIGGRRWDYHLLLDHDGTYERTVNREPDFEEKDSGRWKHRSEEKVLQLEPQSQIQGVRTATTWWVLSVQTCEDSNVLLVLREAILAGRNLPILFYRVHSGSRAYGTDWQSRAQQKGTSEFDR